MFSTKYLNKNILFHLPFLFCSQQNIYSVTTYINTINFGTFFSSLYLLFSLLFLHFSRYFSRYFSRDCSYIINFVKFFTLPVIAIDTLFFFFWGTLFSRKLYLKNFNISILKTLDLSICTAIYVEIARHCDAHSIWASNFVTSSSVGVL